MTCRPAAPDDVPALVDLMAEFHAEAGVPLDRAGAADAFLALLAAPGRGSVWLIDGRAGYVVLTVRFAMEYGGLDGFIDDLFVRPDFRRQGLAAAALRTVMAEAWRRGLRALHVEVAGDDPAATALYARFGLAPRTDGRVVLTRGLR